MEIRECKPYVRYARVQEKRFPARETVALDHRLFYSLGDGGKIEVGGAAYSLQRGTLLFIRAGVPYRRLAGAPLPPLLALNFDLVYRRECAGAPISYVSATRYSPEQLVEPSLGTSLGFLPDACCISDISLEEPLRETVREYTERRPFFEEKCGALLLGVLIAVARRCALGEVSKRARRVEAILDYLRAHYVEPITGESLAHRFSYHPNYISALVKEKTGLGVKRYLLRLRIERSIPLLCSAEYTVSEAAAAVGFSDMKHFSKTFKQIVGKPPCFYLPRTRP